LFYWIYFAMTGMHALHMIIGLGIMTVILIMAWRGKFSPSITRRWKSRAILALRGHHLDLSVPVLYLLGRHLEGHG